MGKEKQYQIEIRSFARQCLESGADTCTCAVIDITARTEKTFLNRYIKTLKREIGELKEYQIMVERIPLLEKTLQICNDRLQVINK